MADDDGYTDSFAPQRGTNEARGGENDGRYDDNDVVGPNSRPRCQSVAWHGERCKNAAKEGQTTCIWHDAAYIDKVNERRFQGPKDDNPNQWHVRCSAKNLRTQKQCGKNAMRGLEVCQYHGGAHPAAREMGERVMQDRIQRLEMRKLMEEHGITEEEAFNPLLQLQKLVVETVRIKDFFLKQMSELEDITYDDRLGIEQVRQAVQLYERAADRTGRLLVDMARLDIDGRLAKISERQGDIIATILQKVLGRLDLADEVRNSAQLYLTEEFKQLEASQGQIA